MIIEDESGEETIYQTEDEGRPGPEHPDRPVQAPPLPSQAGGLGDKPQCTPSGCTGKLKGNKHTLPHKGGRWIVRISDKSGGELDKDTFDFNAIVKIVGSGPGRKLKQDGTHS